MQKAIRPTVNRNVFSWALERFNYQVDDIDIQEKFPKYASWIDGTAKATVSQLESVSKKLRFPFWYFFVDEIPKEQISLPFFRKEDGCFFSEYDDANVKEVIASIEARKNWLSDFLKQNGCEKNRFNGMFKDEKDADKIASEIYNLLDLKKGWTFDKKNFDEVRKFIISKFENENIFVSCSSIVGNAGVKKIPVSLCRGFCFTDDFAPFMFINNGDAKSAQNFTLFHEFAHILTGFSAGFGDFGEEDFPNEKEQLCDKIAAKFLVPNDLLKENSSKTTEELANLFKVSEIVILRRERDCGLISSDEFFKLYEKMQRRITGLDRVKSTGGNFYPTQKIRIGEKFLKCLEFALQTHQISPTDAYSLANLNGKTFSKLIARMNNEISP